RGERRGGADRRAASAGLPLPAALTFAGGSRPARVTLARLAGAAAAATAASAVRNADDVAQIIHAVVIGDFLARLDAPECADEHAAAPAIGLRVGVAGMVGVTRD